ncbi:MAG: metallophosphoesterase [Planctomycetota bacterium]|nr:metallophosphoesterase [Planctomycetota bacterium]
MTDCLYGGTVRASQLSEVVMFLIGDTHGRFDEYLKIVEPMDESLQLGDFGVGFAPLPAVSPAHRFIRGNHDNPELCRQVPNYLGDWGYWEEQGIFFVGGARSVDWWLRRKGISWWEEEELCDAELTRMLQLYQRTRPAIVVSHEGPMEIVRWMFRAQLIEPKKSRTGQALQAALDIWTPKVWCFAHYHWHQQQAISGTEFVALGELGVFRLPPRS